MNGFQFDIPTRIEFGTGICRDALLRTPELKGRRILLVSSGRSLRALGYLAALEAALNALGSVTVYDRVSANPRLSEVEEAVRLGKAARAEAVVGFGGGSSIDAAKVAAAALCGGRSAEELFFRNIPEGAPRLPLVAIPTTAGSGSEVSQSAILTNSATSEKRSIRGRSLFPDAAIVDPAFTAQIPYPVTAETGFDVFAHAMETLVSVKANPLSETFSMRALRLVIASLAVLRDDPHSREARENMSFASLLMGLNLTLAGTLLPHRLQYPIGARKNNSHGAGLLALYPAWLEAEYRVPALREKLDAVARLTGNGGGSVSAIVQFIEGLGVRQSLADMGFAPEDAEALTDAVRGALDNDRAYLGRESVLEIYRRSFR